VAGNHSSVQRLATFRITGDVAALAGSNSAPSADTKKPAFAGKSMG